MILEDTRGLGNLSSRISEILHMPTPSRRLQPILKPIKSYKRPKAAFKKRTPLRIQSSTSTSAKKSGKLRLNQMLGSSVLQRVEHGFLVQEAKIPALPKIRPIKPAAEKDKLRSDVEEFKANPKPSNNDDEAESKKVKNSNMIDKQLKLKEFQSSSTSGLQFTDQSASISHDLNIQPETNILNVIQEASGIVNSNTTNQTNSINQDRLSRRVDHIVLPTASLETISSGRSSGDKAKHLVFPCLQLPRSTEKLNIPSPTTESKETPKHHDLCDIDKNRPKLKKRIMTLLELVSKRDRSLKSKIKNNSVFPNPEFSANVGKPREKTKREKRPKLKVNVDRKNQRYKSQENQSEGTLGQAHSSEIANSRQNGYLTFEDFDDVPFNLNNENWGSPLKPNTKRSSKENLRKFWYSG